MGVHTLKLTADFEAELMSRTGEPTPQRALATYLNLSLKPVKKTSTKRSAKSLKKPSSAQPMTAEQCREVSRKALRSGAKFKYPDWARGSGLTIEEIIGV